MAKINPETITTVALSHAEIHELLEACSAVDWENHDYLSARAKLRRAVKPPTVHIHDQRSTIAHDPSTVSESTLPH